MKIILSRKGFDSGCGGVPSPIMPDGRLISLAIPSISQTRYQDIQSDYSIGELVYHLTKGKYRPNSPVHFDPDLDPSSLPRIEGWRGSLGQTGAAQGHLNGQGVGEGDIFLFFGWFRQVEEYLAQGKNGTFNSWRYVPKSPDLHVLYGYLQIGKQLHLGGQPDEQYWLEQYPWLKGHVHLQSLRDGLNTLHLATEKLTIAETPINAPGAGYFKNIHPDLILTHTQQKNRSVWKMPLWMQSPKENPERLLSYHKDPTRWIRDLDNNLILQVVAKGQEFVLDCGNDIYPLSWITQLVQNHAKPLEIICKNTSCNSI